MVLRQTEEMVTMQKESRWFRTTFNNMPQYFENHEFPGLLRVMGRKGW
jgi:hypothetical protein